MGRLVPKHPSTGVTEVLNALSDTLESRAFDLNAHFLNNTVSLVRQRMVKTVRVEPHNGHLVKVTVNTPEAATEQFFCPNTQSGKAAEFIADQFTTIVE